MSLREKINDQPLLIGGVAAALLLIAVVVFVWWVTTGSGTYSEFGGRAWYYDVTAKELFIESAARVPPFDRDGHVAVRASVGACGPCDDPAARQVLWVERYSETARPLMEQYVQARRTDTITPEALDAEARATEGLLLRGPDESAWVAYNSPHAANLRAAVQTLCDGGPGTLCDAP